jgi:hypothetical protein
MLRMRQERSPGKTVLEGKTKPIRTTKCPSKRTTNVPTKSTWHEIKSAKEQKFQQFPQRNWAERQQLKKLRKKHPNSLTYKHFHVEISIDNVVTQAIVDTGASVSLISEYFFLRLAKDLTENKIESEDEKLHIICGKSMTIAGIYDLRIKLDANKDEI